LKTLSLVDILDQIIFTANPTYTNPTLTLQLDSAQDREIGTTVTPGVTAFGIKNDAGPFTDIYIYRTVNGGSPESVGYGGTSALIRTDQTNIPPQFGYADPNNPNYRYRITDADAYTIPAPASGQIATSILYGASGAYQSGLPKLDSRGNTDTRDTQVRDTEYGQSGDSNFLSEVVGVSGFYPYYWGWSTAGPSGLTAAQIQSLINNGGTSTPGITIFKAIGTVDPELTVNFNPAGPTASSDFWPFFATYAGFPTKTFYEVQPIGSSYKTSALIFGPGTASSKSAFYGVFLQPLTLSCSSPDGYWSNIDYKIYANGQTSKISAVSTNILTWNGRLVTFRT
jgi:hypothetical protein